MPSKYKVRHTQSFRLGLFVAVFTLLIGAYGNAQQTTAYVPPYLAPGPIDEGMPADIILIYNGMYNIKRSSVQAAHELDTGLDRIDGGDWLPQDFLPYVAHLNWEGVPDDTFFDSFLFLGLASERDRKYAGERGQELSGLWLDWQWYIDRLFTPQRQLDALNTTVAYVGDALNDPDYTVNVYIMIPYPSYLVEDFGHIDGTMGGPSLLPVENRLMVTKWYVDTVLEQWAAFQPEHLNLAGFYWLQEHINPVVPDEESFVRDVVAYVHDQGFKIGWIPWSGAYLANRWRSYGFDWTILQPNHMFRDQPGMIEDAAQRGRNNRMGIEIELDGTVKTAASEKKLYDYLDGGVQYGYMEEAMIGYYQDVAVLGQLYDDDGGRWRYLYDDIYAFAKGTYPEPTTASRHVRGRLIDTAGEPIPGAQVQSNDYAVQTDDDGAFLLSGIYASEADLLIVAPSHGAIVTAAPTVAYNDDETVHTIVFESPTEVVVHSFDDTTNMSRIGVTLSTVAEPKTEGEAALQVRLQAGSLNSIGITVTADRTDWSNGTAVALDTMYNGSGQIQLRITLRDQLGQTYTRPFTVTAGEWQTVAIPLRHAVTGKYHESIVPEATGIVDPSHITQVTLAVTADSRSELIIDNLRLLCTSLDVQ